MSRKMKELDDLCSMFPHIERDIISSVYGQNGDRLEETVEQILSLDQSPNPKNLASNYSSPPLGVKAEANGIVQDHSLTPFYGRAEIVGSSSPVVTDLLDEICCLGGEILRYAETDSEWSRIYGILDKIRNQILSNQFQCEYFRLEIFRSAIIPSIRKLKTSRHTTNNRFTQIQLIIGILFPQSSTPDHPANTLMDLEQILSRMREERGGWNSVLVNHLQETIQLEWLPILLDNRRALQKLGSKMILIGILDHFRAAFFILPILVILAEVGLVIRQMNEKKTLNGQNIIKLLKSFMLLSLGGIAIKLIGLLPGFGISSAVFGAIALLISSNDLMLKTACPYVAPNLFRISSYLKAIDSFDEQIFPDVMASFNQTKKTRTQNGRIETSHHED